VRPDVVVQQLRHRGRTAVRQVARLGFERVGEQDTKGGSVRVALLAAAL